MGVPVELGLAGLGVVRVVRGARMVAQPEVAAAVERLDILVMVAQAVRDVQMDLLAQGVVAEVAAGGMHRGYQAVAVAA